MISHKPTVLVVEDDSHACDLYLQVFEAEGCRTLKAVNVTGAKRLINGEKIDLAIVDYWLPDGDGEDIIRYLLEKQPASQSIVVTADDDGKLQNKTIQSGAFAYLSKPVDLEVLRIQSRRALKFCQLTHDNELLHSNVKQAIEELDLRRRELDAIGRISALMDDSGEIGEQGDRALSIVSEFFGKDVALAYFNAINPTSGFALRHHLGLSGKEVSALAVVDATGGLIGMVNDERQPWGAENLRNLPIGYEPGQNDPIRLDGLRKAFALPILSRGRLLGILVAGYRHDQSLSETEKVLAGSVGRQLRMAMEHIYVSEMATMDSLTNLYNRGYFESRLVQEFSRARRHNHALTVCMADLDGFKQLNDTYGHAFGDRVLREICNSCKQGVRESDFAARYGGEEFALILPETGLEGGEVVAEKVRESVESLKFMPPNGEKADPISVTISIGLASFPDYGENAKEIVQKADQALYHVKLQGGNKVFSIGQSDPA
jgi:diguanylate cyclase (GGDEF)-like protein